MASNVGVGDELSPTPNLHPAGVVSHDSCSQALLARLRSPSPPAMGEGDSWLAPSFRLRRHFGACQGIHPRPSWEMGAGQGYSASELSCNSRM